MSGTYNFIIPCRMPVGDAQKLMVRILNSEYGISNDSANINLFDTSDGRMLNLRNNFLEQNIVDGAELIMM